MIKILLIKKERMSRFFSWIGLSAFGRLMALLDYFLLIFCGDLGEAFVGNEAISG